MTLSSVAIRRPVFTVMVTLALLVFGVLGFTRLGTDLFPDVSFPLVTVTIIYPGAGPREVERGHERLHLGQRHGVVRALRVAPLHVVHGRAGEVRLEREDRRRVRLRLRLALPRQRERAGEVRQIRRPHLRRAGVQASAPRQACALDRGPNRLRK